MTLWLTVSGILAKILGFGSNLLVSYYYGTSGTTDAFFLALMIPYLLISALTSAADGAIIPQYSEIAMSDGRETADRYYSNITNISAIVAVALGLLMYIFADGFIAVFASGFIGEQRELAVMYLRIFSFIGLFNLLYCYFSSYNTIYKDAVARAYIPVLTNIIVIAGLVLFHDEKMLVYAVVFLFVSMMGGIVPILYAKNNGFRYSLLIDVRDTKFRKFIAASVPIAGTALLFNLYTTVGGALASRLTEGSVSALNYAAKITAVFDSLVVAGIGAVLTVYLSEIYVSKDLGLLFKSVDKVVFAICVFLLPIVIVSMVLSEELIRFVYMRGAFDEGAVKRVKDVFLFLAPQIIFLSLHGILTKVYYSLHQPKAPLLVTFIGFILFVGGGSLLSQWLGVNGIAIAISGSMIITCVILMYLLGRQMNKIVFLQKKYGVLLLAGGVISVEMYGLKELIQPPLLRMLIAGSIGMITFAAILLLLIPSEMKPMLKIRRTKG